MRTLLSFAACCALGLVLACGVLLGLMFCGQFALIDAWSLSGRPVALLALWGLPEDFWTALTGVADAGRNPSVRSFLQLCVALGQVGLLLAMGLFRLWYRR